MCVQHIEFFDRDHFYYHFHRQKVKGSLSTFIDFFWETNFDELWERHPKGFTDALFPDVGYTYMISLGTPYKIAFDGKEFTVKKDAFLPRFKNILTTHAPGNKVFGIKFKISPELLHKRINFSEYTAQIFPLAYLADKTVTDSVRRAKSFEERVDSVSAYYKSIIKNYSGSLLPVEIVKDVLSDYYKSDCTPTVAEYAAKHHISTRTLERYFKTITSISSKQALQIIRIRKAITAYVQSPSAFRYADYGYFDHSHFYKHISGFLRSHTGANISSHLALLKGSGIINY